MTKSISAEELAKRLLKDLKGRQGFDTGCIAKDVMEEWAAEWTAIIKTATEPLKKRISELKQEEIEFPSKQCVCGCGALDGECANGYREQIEELQQGLEKALMERDVANRRVEPLESQNALLVEALGRISQSQDCHGPNCHHCVTGDHPPTWEAKLAAETLTNTAQAAKERDERIKAETFKKVDFLICEHARNQAISLLTMMLIELKQCAPNTVLHMSYDKKVSEIVSSLKRSVKREVV